jgi:DNA-binding MarR family transcriptional regulator
VPAQIPLPWDPIAEARRQWVDHGWEAAADGMAVVTSVMRAQQILLGRVEAELKPLGLSFARFEMLRLLAFTRGGALPMASASARLQVHPTSVTNTVDRLEQAGMVGRLPHPTDGRATLVTITDSGRRIVDEATELLNSQFFVDIGLERDDLIALVRILARFRRDSGDFVDAVQPPEPL